MDKMHKLAKMDTLKALRKAAMEMIHDRMGDEEMPEGMSKVMVAAEDKEGLEEGLDKAKEVLGEMPEGMEDSEEKEMMAEMKPEESLMSDEDEEIELLKKLQELRAKKKQMA